MKKLALATAAIFVSQPVLVFAQGIQTVDLATEASKHTQDQKKESGKSAGEKKKDDALVADAPSKAQQAVDKGVDLYKKAPPNPNTLRKGADKILGTDHAPTDVNLSSAASGAAGATAAGSGIPLLGIVGGIAAVGAVAAGAGGGGGGGGDLPAMDVAIGSPVSGGTGSGSSTGPSYLYSADYANSADTLKAINAYTLQSQGFDGAGVQVGIIDSGVNPHSEFGSRLAAGKDFSGDNNPTGQVDDPTGHGTSVAGIIGMGADGSGGVGVAPKSIIVPLKVFNSQGNGNTSMVINAIDYAAANSIPIINISLIVATQNAFLNQSLASYANAGGMGTISAGNQGATTVAEPGASLADPTQNIPAAYIVVGSGMYDANQAFLGLASYSNKAGVAKDFYLVAPGNNLYTTTSTGGYTANFSGTSAAAPVVAGAMALIKAKWPQMTNLQVVSLLLNSATDVGASGVDDVYGHGLLNIPAAMSPQGITTTSIHGQSVPLNQALGAMIRALPAGVTPQGNLAFVDSYNRDFHISAQSIRSGPPMDQVAVLQNMSSNPAVKQSLQSNLLFSFQSDAQSDFGVLSQAQSFPFAVHNNEQGKAFTGVSFGLTDSTWIGAGASADFSAAEIQQKWGRGFSTSVQFNTTNCETNRDSQCSSRSQRVAAQYNGNRYQLSVFSAKKWQSVEAGILGASSTFESFGASGVFELGSGWSLATRIDQRPRLTGGHIDNVAVGYNQQTGQFVMGSLNLQQSSAPVYTELALLQKLNKGEAVKYSFEGNSNYDGLGHAQYQVFARYSLAF